MRRIEKLTKDIEVCLGGLYEGLEVKDLSLQHTRKEFDGDYTIVVFPYVRFSKKSPEATAEELGEKLQSEGLIVSYNVVKGFLNFSLKNDFWADSLLEIHEAERFGFAKSGSKAKVMVEYSSPNTNKPLHLGHIRNNFLGFSVAEILKANGNEVVKVQIINDRGIHICKSMLAWQKFGNGETPSAELKGDKLVGKYYVEFDRRYKEEIQSLVEAGMEEKEAEKKAPLMLEAQEMLRKWEAKDSEVYDLWQKMNSWVYEGFDVTYDRMGVDFDKLYYESNTYLDGKTQVLEGLEKAVFYKKEDGSVWCDLSDDGLDQKLLLRADGTAVYMTQDIGTAILRFKDFPELKKLIYTVGNEQDYHFKVLFLILKKLGYDWSEELYHLSYGMVDLPSGKMKSREGTVVDADDLMDEMFDTARAKTEDLGKLEGLSEEERKELFEMIGMAALKYFILKVDPKKRMMFDPEESIDFNGNTGPFLQYTYARIQSLLRKGGAYEYDPAQLLELSQKEKDLLSILQDYPNKINEAASEMNPGSIANYTYDLVKAYNSFYQSSPIIQPGKPEQTSFRLCLSENVGKVIKSSLGLLGIQVPDKM